MKKRMIIAVGIICAALVCGGVALMYVNKSATTEDSSTDSEQTLHLSLSTDAFENSTIYQIAQNFADRVEEKTNGAIVIDLYEYGTLGKNANMIQMLGGNIPTADILFVPSGAMVEAGCQNIQDIMKSGTFKDHADFAKWVASSKTEKYLNEPEQNGLGCKGLFFLEDGFYQTFLKEDKSIAGGTILGMGFDESEKYYTKKKATYEPGVFLDIPDRVAAGTIVGAELPLDQYEEEKIYESLPFVAQDNHIVSPYEAVIALKASEKIGEKNVQILKEAGNATIKEYGDILERTDAETIKRLQEAGAKIAKLK